MNDFLFRWREDKKDSLLVNCSITDGRDSLLAGWEYASQVGLPFSLPHHHIKLRIPHLRETRKRRKTTYSYLDMYIKDI